MIEVREFADIIRKAKNAGITGLHDAATGNVIDGCSVSDMMTGMISHLMKLKASDERWVLHNDAGKWRYVRTAEINDDMTKMMIEFENFQVNPDELADRQRL